MFFSCNCQPGQDHCAVNKSQGSLLYIIANTHPLVQITRENLLFINNIIPFIKLCDHYKGMFSCPIKSTHSNTIKQIGYLSSSVWSGVVGTVNLGRHGWGIQPDFFTCQNIWVAIEWLSYGSYSHSYEISAVSLEGWR